MPACHSRTLQTSLVGDIAISNSAAQENCQASRIAGSTLSLGSEAKWQRRQQESQTVVVQDEAGVDLGTKSVQRMLQNMRDMCINLASLLQ